MPRWYHSVDELPRALPIFPLTGALLLPRGELPLNVFEPRYLAMVDTAMAGPRLIGMIQPSESDGKTSSHTLASVGTAGRLTSFKETEDGRYLITLSGICRFRVAGEMSVLTPYRQIQADYTPYASDLISIEEPELPRTRLAAALKDYLQRRDMKADWSAVMNAPAEMLVNALVTLCPFEPAEKQALLEALTWQERVDTLVALLEISGAGVGSGGGGSVN
ncbi:MAG TPA: LON peptidase substrate-binding domain-containing protein [Rhizomicrobium sp.]|jgi:Lon protease-like protein|nr:LON peptidase substrate-binding domain-containing protein [Rhizomicrobium sp.]